MLVEVETVLRAVFTLDCRLDVVALPPFGVQTQFQLLLVEVHRELVELRIEIRFSYGWHKRWRNFLAHDLIPFGVFEPFMLLDLLNTLYSLSGVLGQESGQQIHHGVLTINEIREGKFIVKDANVHLVGVFGIVGWQACQHFV